MLPLLLAMVIPAQAETTTIFFDNEGPEEGITVPGACCFTVAGTNFAANAAIQVAGTPIPTHTLPAAPAP